MRIDDGDEYDMAVFIDTLQNLRPKRTHQKPPPPPSACTALRIASGVAGASSGTRIVGLTEWTASAEEMVEAAWEAEAEWEAAALAGKEAREEAGSGWAAPARSDWAAVEQEREAAALAALGPEAGGVKRAREEEDAREDCGCVPAAA